MERKDFQIELASHQLGDLIRSIVNSDEVNTRDTKVKFADIDQSPATCDAYLIERAIRNLYYNALKYAKGEVSLSF